MLQSGGGGRKSKGVPATATELTTLEPKWKDETVPTLLVQSADVAELEKCHLILAVFDQDVGSADDLMGQVVLPLAEFVKAGKTAFDRTITLNGTYAGKIKGYIEVAWPDENGNRPENSVKKKAVRSCCTIM